MHKRTATFCKEILKNFRDFFFFRKGLLHTLLKTTSAQKCRIKVSFMARKSKILSFLLRSCFKVFRSLQKHEPWLVMCHLWLNWKYCLKSVLCADFLIIWGIRDKKCWEVHYSLVHTYLVVMFLVMMFISDKNGDGIMFVSKISV